MSLAKAQIDLIEKYIKDHPEITSPQILADKILKENPSVKTNRDSLRSLIGKKRRKIDSNKIEIETEEEEKEEPYFVEKETYHFDTKKYGRISLSVEFVDQLFYEYSEHGLNKTQTEIMNDYQIKPWEWFIVKSRLLLFKKSNVFSPWTVTITPPEKLSEMRQEKMEKAVNRPLNIIAKDYQKVLNKSYKKTIDRDRKLIYLEEYLATNLAEDFLPKIKEVRVSTNSSFVAKKHRVFVLSDLHIGARVEGLSLTRDYNIDILRSYLKEIANQINSSRSESVTLILLGDHIESFQGGNHLQVWTEMEWALYGEKVIPTAIEVLEEFFASVNNITNIYGISGNHDRSSNKRDEDLKGTIAGTIFYFLKRFYGAKINIQYKWDVLTVNVDGIEYILTHGHLDLAKRKGEEIIFEYGDNKKFNVLLTGHIHTRAIKKDSDKMRWVVCPSLFTGNTFSEGLLFHTCPGYLEISNNGKGRPVITDYSL